MKLEWYKLDVNDFVSYLFLFPNLDYLEMSGILIKPGELRGYPQVQLPKFEGVLQLASSGYHRSITHEVIDTLTNIPTDMNYSHIILGSGVVKQGGAEDCLRPFLLKSRHKLECLDISCESILAHIGCAHDCLGLGVNCNLILCARQMGSC